MIKSNSKKTKIDNQQDQDKVKAPSAAKTPDQSANSAGHTTEQQYQNEYTQQQNTNPQAESLQQASYLPLTSPIPVKYHN